MESGDEHAAIVEDGRGHLLRGGLAFLLVHVADLVQHRVVRAHAGELHRVVALGHREAAGGVDVRFRRAPHERHELAERIAHALELLDGHGGGAAEEVPDHEVRAEALSDVEHLGAHLHARGRHGEDLELEAFQGREILQDLDRLPPGGIVVEDERDLLALEVPSELLLHEVHRGRCLRPVRGGDGEDVGIADAVGSGGATEARGGAGDPIFRQLRRERIDVRRAVDGDGHRAFLLVALVGLHARRHLVLVVDLQRLDLVALDPALGVDQRDVVVEARAEDRPHDLGRPRPIALHADDDVGLRLGVGGRGAHEVARSHQECCQDGKVEAHCCSPFFAHFSTRMARSGNSCGYSATGGSAPRARRRGRR